MSIGTLLRYLVGNRQAILQIAGTRNVLILGILFVMSAGLAREYDSRDLIHEPAYLFAPLVASVATSFVLFF